MRSAFGDKIKKLRKEKGYTLDTLAATIGSGKSYMWELENKNIKRPSAEKVLAIAKTLGVTVEYLLEDSNIHTNPIYIEEKQVNTEEQAVFFRKMNSLTKNDQQKVMDIMDAWCKK